MHGDAAAPGICKQQTGNDLVVLLQVVFLGVFLLTRASQPGAAAAGHAAELTPLDSKAHTACIDGDDAATSPSAAATAGPGYERRWQLSAVRSAQSGGQLLVGVCLQQGTSCTWHGRVCRYAVRVFLKSPNSSCR